MTTVEFIQRHLNISEKSINNTLQLLSEDCTIPFISRYRKDKTGNLDETQIEQISKISKQFDEIVKRKESILKSIEESGYDVTNEIEDLKLSDLVEVTQGQLKGLRGIIVSIKNTNYVQIQLTSLQQNIKVKLPIHIVKPVSFQL